MGDIMHKCQAENCPNIASVFADLTLGPLFDGKWLCLEHYKEEEKKRDKHDLETSIRYETSKVESMEAELNVVKNHLERLIRIRLDKYGK